MSFRVGSGFDAHRLVPGRPLRLGGLVVPHDRGLEGHSDGDCLVHALCDALLGAVAAGDLGQHFPGDDARWQGASSLVFLERCVALVRERGYVPVNADLTVIAQEPRLAAYLPDMCEQLGPTLGVGPTHISIKAKTTDGLGATGRGEGIAAQAVVLVREA